MCIGRGRPERKSGRVGWGLERSIACPADYRRPGGASWEGRSREGEVSHLFNPTMPTDYWSRLHTPVETENSKDFRSIFKDYNYVLSTKSTTCNTYTVSERKFPPSKSLFTFAINLCHRKFMTADVIVVFVNNQHGIAIRIKIHTRRMQFSADMEENANELHFKYTNFNSSMRKQVKEQWHGKHKLQPVWRTTRHFKHWKYQNLWIYNRGNKYAVCLHFLTYLLNICRKFEFLIFQATYLSWGG